MPWLHMLAVETKRHQLLFSKHLTNIPKWLVAQKKSEGKLIRTKNTFRSPSPSPQPPHPREALPVCFHCCLKYMTKTWKLLEASRTAQGC